MKRDALGISFKLMISLCSLCDLLSGCRYFQMVGMKRRRIWYRLNTLALVVAFAATHIFSILFILHLHCRTQQLSWRDIPCKCVLQEQISKQDACGTSCSFPGAKCATRCTYSNG